MDIGPAVVIVLLAILAAGFFFLVRGRTRVMDYHTDLDDKFELHAAHKMSHGGSGGGGL